MGKIIPKIMQILLLSVIISGCTYFIYREIKFIKKINQLNFSDIARIQLKKDAEILDSIFESISGRVATLSTSIFKTTEEKQIKEKLQFYCNDNNVDGLIIAFESNIQGQSYAYMAIKNLELKIVNISEYYDFKSENEYSFWYSNTIKSGKLFWTNAIFDPAYGEKIVICCMPFAANGNRGVVAFIYRTTTIFALLNDYCSIGRYGFPYIIDTLASFVAHPQNEDRSLEELGDDFNDNTLIKFSDAIKNNNINQDFIHYNTATRKKCIELAYPIKHTNWFLGLSVYNGRELESHEFRQEMRQSSLKILIVLFIYFVLILILIKKRFNNIHYNVVYSIFFLLAIITIVSIYNRFPTHSGKSKKNTDIVHFEKWETKRIIDKQSLLRFLDYNTTPQNKSPYIPTGLFINTVQILDDYDMRITGYVWQKYLVSKRRKDENIPDLHYKYKGVIFPEAKINKYELTDSLTISQNNTLMILYRWQFDIEVREQFSNSLYPFGKHEIGIQLWSNSLDDNSILIPDLESYVQLYPDICTGINDRITLNGWNIMASFFSYNQTSYLCNFGNTQTAGMSNFPELYFNIIVSRKFIDNLVCRVIPLMVVLILLFTILFVKQESDSFNIVIGTASLFFVLIFEHINLRQNISSDEIMFIEYCYFFSYAMLLIVTTTSFKIEKSFLEKNFELIDKFLKRHFWTIILGEMFVTALFLFY